MDTIYKFELDVIDNQIVSLPGGAQILSIQEQNGKPFMWAKVDNEAPYETRKFATVGTGNPIHFEKSSPFVATYQLMEGALVFHVFEILD